MGWRARTPFPRKAVAMQLSHLLGLLAHDRSVGCHLDRCVSLRHQDGARVSAARENGRRVLDRDLGHVCAGLRPVGGSSQLLWGDGG